MSAKETKATTFKELAVGDRFVFAGSPEPRLWEKIDAWRYSMPPTMCKSGRRIIKAKLPSRRSQETKVFLVVVRKVLIEEAADKYKHTIGQLVEVWP